MALLGHVRAFVGHVGIVGACCGLCGEIEACSTCEGMLGHFWALMRHFGAVSPNLACEVVCWCFSNSRYIMFGPGSCCFGDCASRLEARKQITTLRSEYNVSQANHNFAKRSVCTELMLVRCSMCVCAILAQGPSKSSRTALLRQQLCESVASVRGKMACALFLRKGHANLLALCRSDNTSM